MKRAFLFLVPFVLHAAPLPDDQAAAYLEQLAASRPKQGATAVHFRETRTSPMLAKPAASEGEIYFQPPLMFRRETSDGGAMVCNGETLWIYSPADHEVERYKLESKGAEAFKGLMAAFNLQDVGQLFRFTVERADEITRITLVPKRRAERRMFDQMVLDVGPDKKLRRAWWSSPGGEQTDLHFSNERQTDSASFEFQPPAGVKVTAPLGR
ncbi:MAG: LolA family protein [Chthoniobacterales bacterium]